MSKAIKEVQLKHGDFVHVIHKEKEMYGQCIELGNRLIIFVSTNGRFSRKYQFGFSDIFFYGYTNLIVKRKVSYKKFRENVPDLRIGIRNPPKQIIVESLVHKYSVQSDISKNNDLFIFGCGAVKLTRKELEIFADYLDPSPEKKKVINKILNIAKRRDIFFKNSSYSSEIAGKLRKLLKDSEAAKNKVSSKNDKR